MLATSPPAEVTRRPLTINEKFQAMSDLIAQLSELIEAAGGKISFSANCRSGIVGDRCRCWRCMKVRPEDEDPSWSEAATEIDRRRVLTRPFRIPAGGAPAPSSRPDPST